MVGEAKTKITEFQSRHTIYLPKDFVNDSQFPFEVGETLVARLDKEKIVIERTHSKRTKR